MIKVVSEVKLWRPTQKDDSFLQSFRTISLNLEEFTNEYGKLYSEMHLSINILVKFDPIEQGKDFRLRLFINFISVIFNKQHIETGRFFKEIQ